MPTNTEKAIREREKRTRARNKARQTSRRSAERAAVAEDKQITKEAKAEA